MKIMKKYAIVVTSSFISMICLVAVLRARSVKHEIVYENGVPFLKSTITSYVGWNRSGGFSLKVSIGSVVDGKTILCSNEQMEFLKRDTEDSLKELDHNSRKMFWHFWAK
jgi:hypothetical protein